jgi:toxin FitB
MLYVLDTNVISELMKPNADANVMAWFLTHTKDTFATTSINQAEVLGGLALLPEGKRKRSLIASAKEIWVLDLSRGVLPFDSASAEAFAKILQIRTKAARPIQFADAAIAAICVANQAAILTRDQSGFTEIGIKVVNPWG